MIGTDEGNAGIRSLVRRPSLPTTVSVAALGVLPLALILASFVYWMDNNTLAWDFHHELYPQAERMLEGDNPYPSSDHDPATGTNLVWPPLAAFLVAPLTLLPPGSADLLTALLGPALLGMALWLVGTRDWRVYGAFALWPPVFIEPGLSHLTPLIVLLTAAAWRAQASNVRSGLLVGVAVALKLFVWPLAVWLAAIERRRAALVAVLVAATSLVLVVPYTGLDEYASALARVGRAFDQDAYTVYGLVLQAGGAAVVGLALTVALGMTLVWATWRYRSFTLAIATALTVSPIVWLDYFALAAVPLAIARPRFSPIWLVPLATMGLEGAGLAIGNVVDTLRALGSFAVVLAVAFGVEQARNDATPTDVQTQSLRWRHRVATDGPR